MKKTLIFTLVIIGYSFVSLCQLPQLLFKHHHQNNKRSINYPSNSTDTANLVRIPIVFNVVHLGEAIGTGTNISNEALLEALDYLNRYYRKKYDTYYSIEANNYDGRGALDTKIEFFLPNLNENCEYESSIRRFDGRQFQNYQIDGINYNGSNGVSESVLKNATSINPQRYYNIWIVNKISSTTSVSGFAYFPSSYNSSLFGAVIPYNKIDEIVLPHEIGHSLGLTHADMAIGGFTRPHSYQVVRNAADFYSTQLLTAPFTCTPSNNVDGCLFQINDIQDKECEGSLDPKLDLINFGLQNISQAYINIYSDSNLIKTTSWTGNLSFLDTAQIDISNLILTSGSHELRFEIASINNQTDPITANNTISTDITIVQTITSIPYINDFEAPNVDFTLVNHEKSNVSLFNAQQEGGTQAILLEGDAFPATGSLSSIPWIDYNKEYFASVNFCLNADPNKHYKIKFDRYMNKFGTTQFRALANEDQVIPSISEYSEKWQKDSFVVSSYNDDKILVSLQSVSLYDYSTKTRNPYDIGGFVLLDDLSIEEISPSQLDWNIEFQNGTHGCAPLTTSFLNKSFGAPMPTHYSYLTQISETEYDTLRQLDDPTSLRFENEGQFDIHICAHYKNGSTDTLHLNSLIQTKNLEVFPSIINPDNNSINEDVDHTKTWGMRESDILGIHWSKADVGAYGKSSSSYRMSMLNQSFNNPSLLFWLISSGYDFSEMDNLELSFDYAYAAPNSTIAQNEYLSIKISDGCSNNFTEIFNRTGDQLTTTPYNNIYANDLFLPDSTEWNTITIPLNQLANKVGARVRIDVHPALGNSIYIDNIQIKNSNFNALESPVLAGGGQALKFDGINDFVSIPETEGHIEDFSIMAWVYHSGFNDEWVWSRGNSTTNNGQGLYISSAGRLIYSEEFQNGNILTTNKTIPKNKWTHIAVTKSGRNTELYINGILENSTIAFSIQNQETGVFSWGAKNRMTNSGFFNGAIDEAQFVKVRLSEEEVRSWMCKKINYDYPYLDQLVTYFSFDETSTTQAYDLSRYKHGTLINNPVRIASSIPLGNESAHHYDNNWTNKSVQLNTSNESILLNQISGQLEGIHIYHVKDSVNSSQGLYNPKDSITSYFGVFATNNSLSNYDFTYDYGLNPEILEYENKILIQTRDNSLDQVWELKTTNIRNKATNTITSSFDQQHLEIVPFLSLDKNKTLLGGDWNTDSLWLFGLPENNEVVTISSEDSITINTPQSVGGIVISDQASFNLGSQLLEINDSTISTYGNGKFYGTNGTVRYNSVNDQIISGQDYGTLILNGQGNKTFMDHITITKELKIESTNASIDLNEVTFLSTDTKTASLGPVPSSVTLLGNAKVQRFVNATQRKWWHLSSPFSNATVADWIDDFPITGNFGGASNLGGLNNSSVFWYDETNPSTSSNDGWIDFPSNDLTEIVVPGKGYRAFLRNGSSTAIGNTTISLTGELNYGDVNIPVTYTSNSTNDTLAAGWNFIGNPYASTIDWNSPSWRKTDIDDAIYVWDALNSRYTSYVNGIGTNNGSNEIAQGQAFWVRANSSISQLTATEQVKVNSQRELFKLSTNPRPVLYIAISNELYSSNTAVSTDQSASINFDHQLDANYLGGSYPLNICTFFDNNYYSINTISETSNQQDIPIYIVNSGTPDTYQLDLSNTSSFTSDVVFELLDLYVSQTMPIIDHLSYSFEVTNDVNSKADTRFILRKRNNITALDYSIDQTNSFSIYPNPSKKSDGINILLNDSEATEIYLYNIYGRLLLSQPILPNKRIIKLNTENLNAGTYIVTTNDSLNSKKKIVISE